MTGGSRTGSGNASRIYLHLYSSYSKDPSAKASALGIDHPGRSGTFNWVFMTDPRYLQVELLILVQRIERKNSYWFRFSYEGGGRYSLTSSTIKTPITPDIVSTIHQIQDCSAPQSIRKNALQTRDRVSSCNSCCSSRCPASSLGAMWFVTHLCLKSIESNSSSRWYRVYRSDNLCCRSRLC